VTPEDIKALRKKLRCTPRELAAALGVSPEVVMAWEHDDQFPTKQFIERMQDLADKGPGAVVRMRGRKHESSPLKVLAEPELWRIIRKLIAYPELREQVGKLAEAFDDPE
jgi:transcriptional regulator with XRE-family HTH domain